MHLHRFALVLALFALACSDDPAAGGAPGNDAGAGGEAGAGGTGGTAGEGGTGGDTPSDAYEYTPPPAEVPEGLDMATWSTHLREDLLPFWLMDEAKGEPAGNFPTWRTMTGALAPNTARKSRMLGRQTYAYAAAYLITGDEELLALSKAGTRWILDHARDAERGGFHPDLDSSGAPVGDGSKWSQDASYIIMGPAAYFVVTRDPEAEAAVLATRDMLFDPATYWDAENNRIKDGLNGDLTEERWMTAEGSWEIVAQLDPVTAFLLSTQPVFTTEERRTQTLADLRVLAESMQEHWFRDGLFWGTTRGIGRYGDRHNDFGHMLKAFWAVSLIDRRLPDQPFAAFLAEHAGKAVTFALDAENGRWANRPTGPTSKNYGADWWQYAEADQITATLALHDASWLEILGTAASEWRTRFVDRSRPAREVIPNIKRDGSPGFGWPDSDTAKCHEWKNGFHSTEHALVMTIASAWATGEDLPLYFAFPADKIEEYARASKPYTLEGTVKSWDDLGPLAADPSLHKVRVWFTEIR